MGALTPSFLFDFESNMQAIQEMEYARMAQNTFWQKITKVRPSESKRERLAWLLSTAMIRGAGKGGNMQFDDLVALSTEYVNLVADAGLKIDKSRLEDLDGGGLDIGAKWSADIGAYMAYWPQKQIVKAILNGENGLCYDGLSFFNSAHPVNPLQGGSPTFANIFTGGSSGVYPGALPIDSSVTTDVALQNVAKAIAYIRQIKMPNGEDPRFLRAVGIYVPPALVARAQQLTNARFIAQAAASGGGSAEIAAIISNWGLVPPTEVTEFSSGSTYTIDETTTTVSGSDTTWYLACEEISSSQLGAMVYVDREPFKIRYYNEITMAELGRKRELEWQCDGRNVTGYGHPFLLYKVKAA